MINRCKLDFHREVVFYHPIDWLFGFLLALAQHSLNSTMCSVPWLFMRTFIGIWAVMASRLCCSALCSSLWCSSAGSAIFFSGGSPASSLSLSCSRAATWAAIAAWAAAACTAATEWPAKAPAGKRGPPTPVSVWPPSSSGWTAKRDRKGQVMHYKNARYKKYYYAKNTVDLTGR